MSDDSTNLRQEFVAELESILESDEAYGSNLQILTYALKEDVINGKFKDSWNNRVYEFIIDIDGISYKPAAKLDSFGADELPIRFDAYSKGYASLFENGRLDRNLTGKRVKKPKCGNQGYGCGYSCIDLLKTCRILSSGKKAGTNQGKAIGQQRLNKLMELSKKLYLTGDTKKAALAGVIAANISKVRQGHDISGAERMFERRSIKQLGYNSAESSLFPQKTSVKSQEKQLAKLKPEPLSSDTQLSNKEFRVADDTEVREKIKQWTDSYKEIKKMIDNENYETGLDAKRLGAAAEVVRSLIDLSEYGKDYAVFGGIVDSKGKLQAVYTCDELPDGYYVDYLASAPWNCLLSHPDKKTGAGASAIESLIKAAINDNKAGEIKLQSLPDAIPFYKKIGFEIKQEGEVPYMTLDGKSAKRFIESQDKKNRQDGGSIKNNIALTELEQLEEEALGLFTVPQDVYRRVIGKIESRSISN